MSRTKNTAERGSRSCRIETGCRLPIPQPGTGMCAAALALLVAAAPAAADPGRAGAPGPQEFRIAQVGNLQFARSFAWQDGRLTVVDEPLIRVIDEMNRRSKRKIRVDRSDPRLRRLMVSGQFRPGRPEVFVEHIRAAGFEVDVKRDREGNLEVRLGPQRG